MADTKISALPSATVLANLDVLVAHQAGVDKKVTRTLVLTAGAGEVIELVAVSGQSAKMRGSTNLGKVEVTHAGTVEVRATGNINLYDIASTYGFSLQPGGYVLMQSFGVAGSAFVGQAGGPSMTCDNFTGKVVFVAANGCTIPYVDGTAGGWAPLGPPADINTAIDRIIASLNGVGVPIL